jgi:hypothetical protein
MGKALRSGLAALGVCGTCWLATSCGTTTLYLGDDWGDGGGGTGGICDGGGGGSDGDGGLPPCSATDAGENAGEARPE